EPSTPYPTLIFAKDQIHIYVDFIPIISTTSPDDALGLLIAMYSVFELNFNRNSRAIRFLYAILHNNKRFLSNTMHLLIKEKDIDIINEINRQQITSPNSISNNSTTLSTSSKISTHNKIITESTSMDEENNFNVPDPTNSCYSNGSIDLNSNRSIVLNE
ncbi:unnamed protein product, partial [Rotaria sp. Silwood2]